MATIVMIQMMFFSVVFSEQLIGDSNLDGLWFHITSAGNPFLRSSQSPCLLRGPLAVKRDDYTFTPGIGAHKVHTKAATWTRAWEICENEGAHLVILNSYTESRLMVQLLDKAGPMEGGNEPEYAHVGFHDLYMPRKFVTIHGESLLETGFTEWNGDEPSKVGDNERCGSIHKNGKLNDIDCGSKTCRFICELPYVEPEAALLTG